MRSSPGVSSYARSASATIAPSPSRATIARSAATAAPAAPAGRPRAASSRSAVSRPVLDAVAVAVGEVHRRGGERERGVRRQLVGPEAPEPGLTSATRPFGDAAAGDRPQQPPGAVHVAGRDRVLERRRRSSPSCSCQVAGPAVQRGDRLRLVPAQLGAQHLPEQRVMAVLGLGRVERDERDARAREVAQHRARAGGRRARRRTAGPDSRPRIDVRRRKSASAAGRPRQDLVAQVVGDQPVVAGEVGRRAGCAIAAPAQRQRGEVQGGGPALGVAQQHGEVGRARGRRRPC